MNSFWVQGNAQRCEMVRPRRVEQHLPEEGVAPERNAGARNAVAASLHRPDLYLTEPLHAMLQALYYRELQPSAVPRKLFNPRRSELTKKMTFTVHEKPFGIMALN